MQLSKRLSAVAEFVTPGGCLVDVGTDHGYVPIALLEQKKISSAPRTAGAGQGAYCAV